MRFCLHSSVLIQVFISYTIDGATRFCTLPFVVTGKTSCPFVVQMTPLPAFPTTFTPYMPLFDGRQQRVRRTSNNTFGGRQQRC